MTADSIVEAVLLHAQRQPDKLCLADEQEQVTYSQYARRIRNLAGALGALGIRSGDALVVEVQQTSLCLAAELALHLLGAVFVPAERNCAEEKLLSIAAVSQAKGILSPKKPRGELLYISYDQARTMAEEGPAFTPDALPSRDTVSEILFSTGTTGKEKGIVLTHGNDVALAENVMAGVHMEPDNVELIPSPMNHSHGLRRYYGNMLCGGTVVLLTGVLNVRGLFGAVETYGVNAMDLVPSALSVLLKLSKGKLAEYRRQIRYIQLGAAPLMKADKEELKRLLPETRLYNFYGSTESGCICIYEFGHGADKENCIGRPACNARIVITDEDRRPIRSSRENPGILASYGEMNMLGYWQDPAETEKVLADGYVYTDDEAYFDEDGDIILLGRRGDVINVGGNKVSPEEIENAAKKMDGVADCACVPVPDPLKGAVPKLFVQMERGRPFDPAALSGYLAERLEPYKVPKYFEAIEQIPRTFNGKILRRKLPRSV